MSAQDDRIAYGKAAEYMLFNNLVSHFTEQRVQLTESSSKWTPSYDLQNGDIIIKHATKKETKIDVKRINKQGKAFISCDSAIYFQGRYFAFVDVDNVDDTYFIDSFIIKAYMKKISINNLVKPFESLGYYFNPKKMYTALTYEMFIKKMIT